MLLTETAGTSKRLKICDGNLALLREKISHDPESYGAEFEEQLEHFLQQMRLLQLQPIMHREQLNSLLSLIDFLANTSHKFPAKVSQFGQSLLETLESPPITETDPELRLALCKALVRLTTKQAVDLFKTVPLLFQMLGCRDKQLRKFILGSLITFIKCCSKVAPKKRKLKGRKRVAKRRGAFSTQSSNRLQQLLFSMLQQQASSVSARIAQMALVDAYRKQFWRDAKTANALAECVFHKVQRIQVSTMRFFLGSSKDEQDGNQESSDDEEEEAKQESKTLKEVMQQFKHAKKTKKRQKHLDQARKTIGREKKSKRERNARNCNLEAIRSIYDPQRFTDRLFGQLDGRKNEKYAIRLLQIALCARVIGVHRLQTLGFYSYMHRYLQPKQKEVTRLLLYAAQACHELVPPDVIEQMVRVIAQNFVSDRNTPEAITVGLNTIREIYTNCPAAATEEMVRDLAEYKKMHNKNVSMAARALIALLRQVQPRLLHHKDRGKPTTASAITKANFEQFGELKALDHIPGAEILPEDAEEAELLAQQMNSSDEEELEDDDDGEEQEEAGEESEMEDADMEGSINDEDEAEESEEDEEIEDEEGRESEEEMMEEEEDDGEQAELDDEHGESTKPTTIAPMNKAKLKSQKKAAALADRKEAEERAKQISESRILTDADFRLLRIQQLRQQAGFDRGNQKRKRTNDELRVEEEIQEKFARTEVGDGLPRLNDIEHFHKKIRKQTKEERLEQVRQGRDGRPEYGRPTKRGSHVGRTNRELAKRKNFQMVRHKVRGKNRQRSFRDQQISLRNYLLRQQGKKV